MQPTLRMGSVGGDVNLLQRSLNEAGGSAQPRLATDGRFGFLTHRRVAEFQGHRSLVADGIVGPKTWAALETFIALVKGFVDKVEPPQGEKMARTRIVQTAERFADLHGWSPASQVGSNPERIAANKCADAATRLRQGGAVLAGVWGAAGVSIPPAKRCLTLSPTAEANYAQGAGGRNVWDIPSWCGIFALSCYRLSGLRMSAWPLRHQGFSQRPELRPVTSRKDVKPGDLGIFDFRPNHTNHHFLVVDVAGDLVTSVEGNVSLPVGEDRFQTVVRRRKFGIQQIMSDPFSAFVTPIWEKVAS